LERDKTSWNGNNSNIGLARLLKHLLVDFFWFNSSQTEDMPEFLFLVGMFSDPQMMQKIWKSKIDF
jgi:hypothetical protein